MNIEKIAKAVEADAGHALPELRQALKEARAGLGRATTPAQILTRSARRACGMTQEEFAARIDTPVATLRDWEQGRFAPPGGVLVLFRLVLARPELARQIEEVAG